jgi:putative (di)nucleoside polyphosphate hydrolase
MSRARSPSAGKRELPYRPCVGVMLLNRDGLVFVGRRKSEAGSEHVADGYAWQMPQGGIDPGETPYEAALRELYEETNIRSVRLLAEAPEWYAYDLPPIVAGRAWKGRFRGQTQKWFALRFEGDESEIDINRPAGGQHKPEFDEWRWEAMSNLPGLIIPFKRSVYENVVAAFSHLGREDAGAPE